MKTNARPVIQDVDLLPDAAWDLIDLSIKNMVPSSRVFSINLARPGDVRLNAIGAQNQSMETATIQRSPERSLKSNISSTTTIYNTSGWRMIFSA